MIRSNAQVSAARREAAPFVGKTYTDDDGTVWSFWSMAPVEKTGHWVTDGSRFRLATERGLEPLSPIEPTKDGGSRGSGESGGYGMPLVDDVVTPRARMMPRRSPGCTCADCGSKAARALALEHARR